MSIGVIALVLQAVLFYPWKQTWQQFLVSRDRQAIMLLFVVLLISGWNSSDGQAWMNWMRIASVFVALPLCSAAFTIQKKLFERLLQLFVAIMAISVLVVLVVYLWHYKEWNASLLLGQAIPVPFSHIRYNLLLVFAACCSWWLFQEETSKWRSFYALPLLLFVVAVHLLASRSGWLALYACALLAVLDALFRRGNWRLGWTLISFMAVMPFVAYYTFEPVRLRIDFMHYDLQQYKVGHIEGNSDAMRLASWKTGAQLIRENFWTGVGAGDMLQESQRVGRRAYPDTPLEDLKMPHNEFLWIFAATGIFGFLGFCFSFLAPFWINRSKGWLLWSLFVIFFTAFFTEYPLHEQVGSIFYLSFLSLFMAYRP